MVIVQYLKGHYGSQFGIAQFVAHIGKSKSSRSGYLCTQNKTMIFYIGLHHVNHARHFENCFISVNRLRDRRSDFVVKNWILDSGAFTEISKYGHYRSPVSEYVEQVNRWAKCGNLEMAVTQDYMCESFILTKTGLSIEEHQRLTIERYDELRRLTEVAIMPVLQGYEAEDYLRHLDSYGNRLVEDMRVGVGSICKRNSDIRVIARILEAIKNARPDLLLHGFGLKTTALADNYVLSLLYSADSMAWSYAARRNGGDANGLREALEFVNKIEQTQGANQHQFLMKFNLEL
jgi:hypothetical protein